jgi:sulfotransferase family protein
VSRPNLFIVGAPKCGTTALHEYLSRHPEIFMSRVKEPGYFASDLVLSRRHFVGLDDYLALFSEAGEAKRIGESSTNYLRSNRAAEEICAFNPESVIIAMVRNPIDVMHSFHSQLLYQGEEDIEDFEAALAAEPARTRIAARPNGSPIPDSVLYRKVVLFAEQIERYLHRFGRDNVHVIVHDDFVRDTAREYERVLQFLSVDSTFGPSAFTVVNPNKKPRSATVHRFLVHPPAGAQAVVRTVVPERARAVMSGRIRRLNTAHERRTPMPAELRKRLARELAPEVDRLGALLERDLSHWTRV